MGGIFSSPSAPPPPDTSAVSRREREAEARESRKQTALSRQARNRRMGGQRMLLGESGARGVEFDRTATLGYGRNPRT